MGLRRWVRPIAYCEIERKPQHTLLERMQQGLIWPAPIWDDVRTLNGREIPTGIDIVYGGFPCQDISAAGNGRGLVGERSGLYWEIARLVEETNPSFIFLENVPAIRTRGLNAVVQSLTELGYGCRWTIVSAQELGAPHIRKRWFLLAHANGLRLWEKQWAEQSTGARSLQPDYDGSQKLVANTKGAGLSRRAQRNSRGANGQAQSRGEVHRRLFEPCRPGWWEVEPSVGRVADGVTLRVDRLRECGNGVIPEQVEEAFMRLMGLTDFLR